MNRLKCPHCQKITTTVALSLETKSDGSIVRCRHCLNCFLRFNTIERYTDYSCNALDRQTDRQTIS